MADDLSWRRAGVSPRRSSPWDRILVGTDGSPTATRAVDAAALLAASNGAELVIAHVFSPRMEELPVADPSGELAAMAWKVTPGAVAEHVAEVAAQRAREVDGSLVVRTRCEPGRPVPQLLRLVSALDVDAVVVGNRDMRLAPRLRRSVSRAVSRRAACDVVVVDTVGRRRA